MPAPPPPKDGNPVRALCITLGGARRARMEKLFRTGSPWVRSGIELTFIEGIQQRSLRSRAGLIAALRKAGLLDRVGQCAEVEERCWRAMRHLGRSRAVLACTLAHLMAMKKCVEEGYDCIVEDNVCGPPDGQEIARRIRECAAASPSADMRYYAYGGRSHEIDSWQQTLKLVHDKQQTSDTVPPAAVDWPTVRSVSILGGSAPRNDSNKQSAENKKFPALLSDPNKDYNLLWGTLCYAVGKTAYDAIMSEIGADMPGALAWSPRRSKSQIAKPADKIFPRLVIRRGLKIKVATRPALFRAPIVSTIHSKYDAQFIETSRVQLGWSGLKWNDMGLSPEEINLVEVSQQVGNKSQSPQGTDLAHGRGNYRGRKERCIVPPTQGHAQSCNVCGANFPSKNKLFKHIRASGTTCSKEVAPVPSHCSSRSEDIPAVLQCAIKEGYFSLDSSTPPWALLFDLDALESTLSDLNRSFPENFTHCFAVKSNPVTKLLKRVVDGKSGGTNNIGLECASFVEVMHSIRCGCPPESVVFDSPCKSKHEIRECLRLGVLLNCDNLTELSRVATIWDDMEIFWKETSSESDRPKSQVGIRVNPLLGKGSIEALSVSTSDSKFGIPLTVENHAKILDAFKRYPWLCALHAHVGSQGCNLRMLAGGAVVLAKLADEIDGLLNQIRIKTIDIGGGLPTNFDSDTVTPTFEEYAKVLHEEAPALFDPAYSHRRYITEFGRATICKLGWTASRIEYVKETPYRVPTDASNRQVAGTTKRVAIIHAGSDMFLRTCYCPQNFPLRLETYRADGNSFSEVSKYAMYDVAGPLCFGGDKVGRNVVLPNGLSEGDFVVVRDSGANCFSLWSRHCSRQSPAVLGYSFKSSAEAANTEVESASVQPKSRLASITLLRACESIDSVLAFWK